MKIRRNEIFKKTKSNVQKNKFIEEISKIKVKMEDQYETGSEASKFEELEWCHQIIYTCLVFEKQNNLGSE
jgi:hypothetical protein